MSDPSPEPGAPVGFRGRLEGLSPSEVLWRICRDGRSGVLRVQREAICREVYIRDGRIVFLTSSDPNDRLGERLLRQRKITLDQLEQVLGQMRSGKRLGTLLVEAGAIAEEEIGPAVLCQLRAVLLDLLGWRRGEYEFREGGSRSQETITLDVSTAALLFHGVRNQPSVQRIQAAIGPPFTTYVLRPAGMAALADLQLTEGEKLVLDRLQAGPATLGELCRELLVAAWEVCEAVHGFLLLEIVERTPSVPADGDELDAGRLDQRSLPELLIALHVSRRTGMLRLERDGVTRRLHVESGRPVFAGSSDPDDSLVSQLFRSGMISLGDLEEANRRMHSGRRPGSILRELGVLDDSDLQQAVRRQVGEIILDSFGWTDGLWAFRAGPLPTAEEITLDQSIPALIAEGVRRIGSWTRLVRGCGGIDHPLALAAGHETILEAIEAGNEEQRIVRALATGQSPRRVCAAAEVDALRVLQVLWTLRLLGAINDAPSEDDVEVDDDLPLMPAEWTLPDEELPARATAAADDWNLPTGGDAAATAAPVAEPVVVWTAPDPVAPAAAREPEWSAPPELVAVVDRFNAMHQVIFLALKAEIGAGAGNFVRACCAPFDADGIELGADGVWDADGLYRVVRARGIEDPWPEYQRILEGIYERVRPHLGPARADALKAQILALEPARSGADGAQSDSRYGSNSSPS